MKSVLFVSYSMGIGGVEKALLGVVNKFVNEGWDVNIALVKKEGEFLSYLPTSVKTFEIYGFSQIKPVIHAPMLTTIRRLFCQWKLFEALFISFCLVDNKIRKGAIMLYKHEFKSVPTFSDRTFDLAVAFAGPFAFIDMYVDKCVNAKEKWGWIHFDITKFGIDKSIIRFVYRNFSKINVVSEEGMRKFNEVFPEFADKTCVTPNIIEKDSIIRLSEEVVELPQKPNKIVILTVGRISPEKGQYTALQALDILVKAGVTNIEWHFVGTGSDIARCKDFVESNGLIEYVRFLGATANPYPYMRHCDIYVQPSVHEGFCITLAEAKIFGMPIVATEFTGAREQLENYPCGVVVAHKPMQIADALHGLTSKIVFAH